MLRAEVLKLTTTRTAAALLLGAAAVAALTAFSTSGSAEPSSLSQPLHEQQGFLLASINLGLFALVLGARSFTDEFRHGTLAWTLLSVNQRGLVVASKAAVAAGAAAAMAFVSVITLVAVASGVTVGKGARLGLDDTDVMATAGLIAGAAAWAVVGVALGAIVRHQVAAIVGALIWILVIENLAAGFLGDASRYLPGQAAHGLANATAAGDLLSPVAAAGLMSTFASVAVAAAVATLTRRELELPA
jgi:ABC-2 type transport system permease protein